MTRTLGAQWDVVDIPDDMVDQANEYREKMIEAIVEVDDDAMEAYLEGNMPDNDTIRKLSAQGDVRGGVLPCAGRLRVQEQGRPAVCSTRLLISCRARLEVPPIKGIDPKDGSEMVRKSSDDEPLSMLAFKIMNDPFVGSLTFARIYSGKIEAGTGVYNTVKEKRERIGRMLLMHSNNREEIKEAFAGDIVALVGMKDTTTGDTLCDPNKPVILERMEFPEPVIEIAIEPNTKADQEKMGMALGRLMSEDPSFRVKTDEESGQTIISGMGELHLDILVDRMKREFKVEANIGQPQVAYRETISQPTEIDYTHKKQTGGTGQFARVKFRIDPNETGTGNEFKSEIVGGSVPKEYLPGVEKGLQSVWTSGVLIGFPMVDIKVTLYDGAFHEVELECDRVRDRKPRGVP